MAFKMAEPLTTEEFSFLTQRAGFDLTPELIQHLKPLFEQYREQLDFLHSLQLGDRDLAVSFSLCQGL